MSQVTSHRVFDSGTTGWTVDDLHDPDILWQWSEGRYELVDGVLTKMAPQGFEGIDPLSNLQRILDEHLLATRQPGRFHREPDLLLRKGRVLRPDMLFLTREQRRKQKQLQGERKVPRSGYHPIYVTPLLVVESVSHGYEKYDRITKREWYAAAGIQHYWILTWFERSLVCLVLKDGEYIEESRGTENDIVKSSIFEGVTIPLASVWDEE